MFLRIILSVFIVSISVGEHKAFANEDPSVRIEKYHPSFSMRGNVLYFGKLPFDGVQFEKFSDGKVFRETHFKKGIKEGVEREFSLSGNLRVLSNYRKGKKEGRNLAWFEDGAKRYSYFYRNGRFEGEQIEWHQSGTVFRRQVFFDGYEKDRKILFNEGEVFTNFVKRGGRQYGVDGGELCFDKKKDGAR